MKSFAIIALIATATAATAANAINADTIKAHAEQFKAAAEAQGCDWPACIASVAGLSIACGSAAAEAGLNPIADAACISSIGAPTAACNGCT